MFSFFKSKSATPVDWVHRSHKQKIAGLCKMVTESAKSSSVLVVAHFKKTLEEVFSAFESASIGCKFHQRGHGSSLAFLNDLLPTVHLIAVSDLPLKAQGQVVLRHPMKLLSVEHYPLLGPDEELLLFAKRTLALGQVEFFSSLEDPLFRIFGGEKMASLLSTFGWEEGKPINGALIRRSLIAAQKKLAANVKQEHRANSGEEWISYNIKS